MCVDWQCEHVSSRFHQSTHVIAVATCVFYCPLVLVAIRPDESLQLVD